MRHLYQKAYYFYFILVFAVSFLCLFPLFGLLMFRESGHFQAHWLRKIGTRILFVFTGLRLRVKGSGKPLYKGQVLVCSNHASHIDTLAILASIPGFYRFLAKAELLKIPLFGLFFKTVDIPVDRNTASGGRKAYKEAEAFVKRGDSMIFYAEGGIRPGSPVLQPFKSGAFILAKRYQVPVLPITLLQTWERFPDEKSWATPGRMQVIAHPVIHPEEFPEDVEDLKKEVFKIINAPLSKYLNGGK